MNLSADNPFRTEATFRRLFERRDTDREAAELLARSYRVAWNRRGYRRRCDILLYLTVATPQEGVDLVWEALGSRSPTVLGSAAIAAHEYVLRGLEITSVQQRVLGRVIWKAKSPTTVHFALWAIEPSMTEEAYEALLESMRVKHLQPDSRFDASYELLHHGRMDVTTDLIREMRLCEYPNYAAERLLWEKAKAHLSAAQLESVHDVVRQDMDRLRFAATRGDDPWKHAAVYLIEKWVQKYGMAYEPGDIDLVGEAAIDEAEELGDRLDAVKVLGWFANEAADAWLQRLSAKGVAEPVRRAARSQLRKRRRPARSASS